MSFLLARTSHRRGIEPRCDFVTGHSLLRQHENAVDIALGLPRVLLPVQPEGVAAGAAVAASDVFCGRQVTDLESFLLFFLFHFIFLSRCFGLP